MKFCCEKFKKLYAPPDIPLHQNGKEILYLIIMNFPDGFMFGVYVPRTKELMGEKIDYCPFCGTNLKEFWKEI